MERFEEHCKSEADREYQFRHINLHEEDLADIYSYTILGDDEVNPVQIIELCSSQQFRDAITGMDIEQPLLSMNESLSKSI